MAADRHPMSEREEIDEELRQLRRLESGMTDQNILDGLKVLIAELETEKAKLNRGVIPDEGR